MKNIMLLLCTVVLSLSAMEKPSQAPSTPRDDQERKQKSPLKRQDSQKGSLLAGIAKKASDKGLTTMAKAALQLDNKSPERDLMRAELEKDLAKKEELKEKAAVSPLRRGDSSLAKKTAALNLFEEHKKSALNEIETIKRHLEYKNMPQIPSSKKSFKYHYHKARLFYIQALIADGNDFYDWQLQDEADEACKDIRKEYEKRIEKYLSGSQVKLTPA